MKEKTFGETLRALRERKKLSVKEVIERLKTYNIDITDKTLYSYESNKRAASADMLLALCQIYKCNNILETFSGFEPDYSIPDDSEWRLVENYRSLDSAGKNTVDAVIEQEIERSKEVIELLKHIEELELKLQKKYEEQKMVDFTPQEEWKRSTTEKPEDNIVPVNPKIKPYLLPNAAHERTDIEFTEEDRQADEDMLD